MSAQQQRVKGALYGLFVGDATSMPVHWMYNLSQLQRDYGTIRGFVKPKDKFQGSILNLSNTGGGGRGSDRGSIVGDVILHGKKQYWLRGGNNHYHRGLQAGENTLEAQLVRVLLRSSVDNKTYSPQVFLDNYINFMTTPGSHNDTYASTCHRMFFANHVQNIAPNKCADNDGHNVDAIDALTLTIPVIIHYRNESKELRNQMVKQTVNLTRKTNALDRYLEAYSDLLVSVLNGGDLRESVETTAQQLYGPSASMRDIVSRSRGSDPMVACYMNSSFPALLHFAYKYADSVEAAVLACANAGGENVARGSALGALLGAAHGYPNGFPDWAREGLYDKSSILQEIDNFIALSEAQ